MLLGGIISVGECGKSTDNLPIEKFWANIKYECIYKIPYAERSIERIIAEVTKYLKWYHERRRQSNLDYLAPKMKYDQYLASCNHQN